MKSYCVCGHAEGEHVGENFDCDPVHTCTVTGCDCRQFETANPYKKVRCGICGELGHFEKDCPVLDEQIEQSIVKVISKRLRQQ